MKNRLLAALTFAGIILSTQARAQTSTWAIDPNHSSVTFEVVHLGISHVHGSLMGVNGTLQLNEKDITKSVVTSTIETKTVNTGVTARDNDLKSPKYFDIEKYPQITFKSTAVTKSGDKHQLIGDLTLNGVTKSVTMDLDGPVPPQTVKDKVLSAFSATGKIKRSDFNFGSGTPAAVIGDEIKFTIDVEIDKK
jgi:polyisoprenoid-binding protein YceI